MNSNDITSDPFGSHSEVLPTYERILDICVTHQSTQGNNQHPSSTPNHLRACPLLALHESLTAIQTSLSNPFHTLDPASGQESLQELQMRGMSRGFKDLLERGMKEVVDSGIGGPDVLAVVKHAEGIVAGRGVGGQHVG